MAILTNRTVTLAILAAAVAVLYQYVIRDVLFVTYGIGRELQKISDFPYQCRKISDPAIQACEDMWLDEASRTLFLACSDPVARLKWMPNVAKFNAQGRSLEDHIVAMEIDKPKSGGSYEYNVLRPLGYMGAGGEAALYLVGLTGRHAQDGSIKLYLINNQPSFNSTGHLADQASTGANSTVEVFSTSPGSLTMTHIRTFSHPQIATPNNIALMPDGSFYFTNDHGLSKTGWRHEVSTLFRTGDVSHCTSSDPPQCSQVAYGFAFPNGLHYSTHHARLFVPTIGLGDVHVYSPQADHSLKFLETIKLPYPIDNLSEDRDGNIMAAVMPKLGESLSKFVDPDPSGLLPREAALAHAKKALKKEPPSAGFKIRRVGAGLEGQQYEATKEIEDADGEVLPVSTTVIRDAKTGRLFFSGVVNDWVTVCEPKR